jgi:hypothetical protein
MKYKLRAVKTHIYAGGVDFPPSYEPASFLLECGHITFVNYPGNKWGSTKRRCYSCAGNITSPGIKVMRYVTELIEELHSDLTWDDIHPDIRPVDESQP